MTAVAGAARWTAIAIAVACVADPPIPLPTRARPAVRILTSIETSQGGPLASALKEAGFAVNGAEPEAATVIVGDHVPAALLEQHGAPSTEHPAPSTEHPAPSTELWALDTTPRAPDVRIVSARGPAVRLPAQAADVRVTIEGRGVAGKTSEVTLEDAGITVASARHLWKGDAEQWQASLQYLPPGLAGGRLHVKVDGISGETSLDDNAVDVGMPPMRGPIRALVVEAGVTWPAMFVRRAIEGEPAFAVAAVQRATKRIATRAGTPPAALTRASLAPFEVALVGAPDNLSAADVDTLRWFVEERGGVVVLIPDQRPTGRYLDLIGAPALEPRALETPVTLTPRSSSHSGTLMASELLVAPRLPPGATTLSASGTGEPVIFSARRGMGAVIFSGALDAWRYRARGEGDADGFARFWRGAIAEEAAAVPPVLEVSIDSPIAAIGAPARVRARLRGTELGSGAESIDVEAVSARAVSSGAHVDEAVRLWPTAEPGVYEGEWRPSVAGAYTITVNAGLHSGDVPVTVAPAASRIPPADPDGLALVARASGGRVFPADRPSELVEAMQQAFPARASTHSSHPMRSPWWVVPFAGLLGAEWALRRRRGLA